jgi:hypothetical protein
MTEETEVEGLGNGIIFREEYEETLAKHKATDMKHDGLTLGEKGSFWDHFFKFIPSTVMDKIRTKNTMGQKRSGAGLSNPFFEPLNDNSFMETYLEGESNRPIKSMLDLIFYCSGESDISNLRNTFGESTNGLANEGKPIHVKFGDQEVYTYNARLQNLNFSLRDDDKKQGVRRIPPTKMLENLGIISGSLFNVDFQYHLWDLLKSGPYDGSYDIYLLMNPENINDPAGK